MIKNKFRAVAFLFIACLSLLIAGIVSACTKEGLPKLSRPENLQISSSGLLTWDEVEGVKYYLVTVNGEEYETEKNSLNLFFETQDGGEFEITVAAMGELRTQIDSDPSKTLEYSSGPRAWTLKPSYDGEEYYVAEVLYPTNNAGIKGSVAGEVVIPSEVDGKKVTQIRSAAFRSCINLTRIVIPENVSAIYSDAFGGCENLESISLPASLEVVDGAFGGCDKISNITLAEGNENFKVVGDSILSADGSYLYCCGQSLEIPDGVKTIGKYVFASRNLTTIDLPEGLEIIDDYAFLHSEIESLNLPASLKVIGKYAFFICEKLQCIDIPSGVESIGEYAFRNCYGLSVILPCTVKKIGASAFDYATIYTDLVNVLDCRERVFPEGWADGTIANSMHEEYEWESRCTVFIGCEFEEEEGRKYLKSFTYNAEISEYPIMNFTFHTYREHGGFIPCRKGYTFVCWADGDGNVVSEKSFSLINVYKDVTNLFVVTDTFEAWVSLTEEDRDKIASGTVLYPVWEPETPAA